MNAQLKAALWMIGSICSFSLMGVGGRELSTDVDTFQTLFLRSVVGLIVVVSIGLITQNTQAFKTQRLPLQLVRNSFHFAGQYGWFLGLGLLPLSEVFALEFTVPLWTLLIAAVLLKESLEWRKIVAVVLGIIGVLIIVQPGSEIYNSASLIVIFAAMGYGFAHTLTKSLTTTDQPLTILFYMCLIQLPIGLVFSIPVWTELSTTQWIWSIVIGLMALSAHFCLTKALQLTEVGIVMTIDFFRLPLIIVVGILLYNEPFKWALLIGASLMLLGNLLNLKSRK